MEIGIKELRERLADILDLVEQGKHVRIIRRGKLVAELRPVSTAPRGLPDLAAFRAAIKVKGKPTSSVVIEERRKPRG